MPDLEAPRCPICRDAGWLRGPVKLGTLVRCICNRDAPPPSQPPPNVVVLRRRGAGKPS